MTRSLTALAALLGLAPLARAQDMPLSQILIEGEGWKKVKSPAPIPIMPGMGQLPPGSAMTASRDGGTLYMCHGRDGVSAITAIPIGGNDSGPGEPYCPLRLPRGKKTIFVTGLLVDMDGRIYAATEIGVQVFDPTGRLCGVLTPAAKGMPRHMAFEGDHLTMWIGDTKYTRKLNTKGSSDRPGL
jgi:hypothetical protein